MTPKGDSSLLGAPQNQHGETYLSNCQIKPKYRYADLCYLQHPHHPLHEGHIVQNETLASEFNLVDNYPYDNIECRLFDDMIANHCLFMN